MEYLKIGKMIGLRPMAMEDCAKIVEWRNNENVRKRYVYREKFNLDAEKKYFEEQVVTGKVFQYMICELNNKGRAIGSIVFKDYEYNERQIEYGLFIGEDDTRGKGYGKEAVQLGFKLGFETFEVDRIICSIFCDNAPSMIANIRAGMRPYKILKDVKCTDGEVKDMVLMEVKREQYDI